MRKPSGLIRQILTIISSFKQTGALHVINTPEYSVDIALRIKRE